MNYFAVPGIDHNFFNTKSDASCKALVYVLKDQMNIKSFNRKFRETVKCKQFICYFLKERFPDMPFDKIKEYSGHTNHASVIHSINTVKDQMQFDKAFKAEVNRYKKIVDNLL